MSALELSFDYDSCFVHNPGLKPSHVTELREWIAVQDKSKGIPLDITDKQLLVFHHSCQLDMTITKKCIEVYYSLKKKSPDMFDERNLDLPIEAETVEFAEYAILPGFTDEGYKVVFHRLVHCPPANYHPPQSNKVFLMTIDRCIYENGTQNKGIVCIYDFAGVGFGHLLKGRVSVTSRYLKYCQEGLPSSIQAVHVLNCNPFFEKVMMFLRPFIKAELSRLINLHMTDEDPEKFFTECVPMRMMPSDYGGLAPDLKSLHKENMNRLRELKPYFDAEEKQRHACFPPEN